MSDETPRRLPSSFPQTPGTARKRGGPQQWSNSPDSTQPFASGTSLSTAKMELEAAAAAPKPAAPVATRTHVPLISFEIADAPTQRFYAVIIFLALQLWKMWDLTALYANEGDSVSELWFCMKWVALDGVFFWFLPVLRIPWLIFSQTFTLSAIAVFSLANILLSLKYFVPISSIAAGFWKLVYDRELSISEKSVKWYDIVHNNSHIQGKYTVHILPEGAAKLNPDGNCFCLGPGLPTVTIPIKINGTHPIQIQLQRIDLETAVAETIDISPKEIKRLMKQADRGDEPELRYLPYVVKQTGIYRLAKVKDVSELDVRVHRSEAMVVTCPKATIKTTKRVQDSCKGDLSDISVSVEGLAPLQVTYSREVKGKPTVFNVQRIHPENFESPLLSGFSSDGTLMHQGDNELTWAKRQSITIPLNETLGSVGDWIYEIDKVSDACGNVVDYRHDEEGDAWVVGKAPQGLSHKIAVHERPVIRFVGCDPQNPMGLPRGKAGGLPISMSTKSGEGPYKLQYAFTPYAKLGSATEHSSEYDLKEQTMKSGSDLVLIKDPGLYSIRSVSSSYCNGDILEPASCLVITPPEPSLTMEYDEILDKCTKSSIGLTIDLTLVGSPPFNLNYRVIKDGGAPEVKNLRIEKTRHQVRFTPEDAGHYAYEFFSLDDKNYQHITMDPATHRAEQTVKPLAGAHFVDSYPRKSCIGEPVTFDIKLQGTPPLTLHYDLIHGGKRTRVTERNITGPIHKITTPPLSKGGEHSVALTSVEDQSGCKIYLESEAKINVRFQRPKAQFAPVEGKFNVRALEGKTVFIPMRLTGEAPWIINLRNVDKGIDMKEVLFRDANTELEVNDVGTYVIESVFDSGCPGTVVESASRFTVSTINRPEIKLPASSSMKVADNGIVHRNDVCEGDEDAVELAFTGTPPFMIDYERLYKPLGKSKHSADRTELKLTAGLGVASVRLESTQAGTYKYKFNNIADNLYGDPRDRNIKSPIVLEQLVHPRPTTSFANPNKVYKYCLDSAAGEDSIIPIYLQGQPPFALTINIKHQSTGKNDHIHVPNVEGNQYDFKIPPHALTLGDHVVSVLKVKDARGCFRKTIEAPHVMVAVADMPTISPADQRNDYCVGERIAFSLAGVPPFAVEYEWNGALMKATNQPSQFIRVAERPGKFDIVGLQDSASDCKVNLSVPKIIHEVPSVRISEGYSVVKGIPEGDQAEIMFTFYGTPPFTFTYTRSEIGKKGSKPRILEMHSHTTDEQTYSLFASQEGTYEVISIEDKFCSYAASSTASRKT